MGVHVSARPSSDPMRRLRIAAGAFSAALAAGACKSDAWFHCENDAQCAALEDGRCEPDHRCSYPDDTCASRRRYGEWSGELSNACVDAPDSSTTLAAESSSTATPTDTTSTATTSEPTTSSTSGTTSTTSTTGSTSGSESTGGLPPQPLGHWPLDDGDNSVTAADIGTGNHPGALVGGTWVRGRIGTGALQLDEEQECVDLGNDDAFALTDASGITMTGWARFDAFPDTNAALISKYNTYSIRFWGTADTGFTANVVVMLEGAVGDGDTDGPIDPYAQISCGSGAMKLVLAGAEAPELDATMWHHFAGTYDLESHWLRLYIDGVQVCEKDVSAAMLDGPVTTSATGLALGRWRPSGNTLFGAIDDLRLYDVALSAAEISAIANETE